MVPGLTRLECSSVSEVLHCLESGSSMRQAGSTAASDLQAHTIFTVHVQQEWADGEAMEGRGIAGGGGGVIRWIGDTVYLQIRVSSVAKHLN